MTGRKLREGTKQVLVEICAGILLFALVGSIIIFLLPTDTAPAVLAFLLGCLLSIASVVHMSYSLELAMDMNNQKATEKYTLTRYLMRMVVWVAVFLLAYFTKYLNMLALLIGFLGTKAGAYLQPLMHRFLECIMRGNKNQKRG